MRLWFLLGGEEWKKSSGCGPEEGMALWDVELGLVSLEWGGCVGQWVAAAFGFCALLVGMSAGACSDSVAGAEKGRNGTATQS